MHTPMTHLRILFVTFAFLTLSVSLSFAGGDPEQDPLGPTTLSVLLPYPSTMGSPSLQGAIYDYIDLHFAAPADIELEWTPVPLERLTDTLSVMLAAGNAPDVSQASLRTVESFHDQNYLAPLDELTAHYGSNITDTAWGTALPYGRFGTDTLWAIPRAQNFPALTSGWVMRQDWLDAVGLSLPTTADSFLDTVLEIRNTDPAGAGPGLAVIGINHDDLGFQIRDIMTSFLDPSVLRSPRERTAYGWGLFPGNTLMSAPGYLDGLRFLNTLSAEGLLPEDWLMEDRDLMYDRYVFADRTFTIAAPFTSFLHRWSRARGDGFSAPRWLPVHPFRAEDGNNYKYAPPLATDALFIPYHTAPESAINAIRYLNWHADPTVHLWMKYGTSNAPGGQPPEPPWRPAGNIMSCGSLCASLFSADSHHSFAQYDAAIDQFVESASSEVLRRILIPQPPDAEIRYSLDDISERQKEWIVRIIPS